MSCLVQLLQDSILTNKDHHTYAFDLNQLAEHTMNFSEQYNSNDAKFLLQLSLMSTNANFQKIELDVPQWLESNSIIIGNDTVIARVIYSAAGNNLFIVFTGTSDKLLVSIDLDYVQIEIEDKVKLHGGIYKTYSTIKQQLYDIINSYPPDCKVIITGHSLGGGLSNIAAYDLSSYMKVLHYSFASPLVFNQIGADMFENKVKHSFCITNQSDIVTMSPLPIMDENIFCHVGVPIIFQFNMGNYRDNHSTAYMITYGVHATRNS